MKGNVGFFSWICHTARVMYWVGLHYPPVTLGFPAWSKRTRMVLEKALESSDADVACLRSTFLDWPEAASLAQLEGWQLAQHFTKLYPILTGQIFPGSVFESCVYRRKSWNQATAWQREVSDWLTWLTSQTSDGFGLSWQRGVAPFLLGFVQPSVYNL